MLGISSRKSTRVLRPEGAVGAEAAPKVAMTFLDQACFVRCDASGVLGSGLVPAAFQVPPALSRDWPRILNRRSAAQISARC